MNVTFSPWPLRENTSHLHPSSHPLLIIPTVQAGFFCLFVCFKGLFFLFIYGCAGSWSLPSLFFRCSDRGLWSSCGAQASHWGLLLLWSAGSRARASVVAAPGLWSTGAWACLAVPRYVGSSQIRNWTRVSCIGRWILYHWTTWGVHYSGFEGQVLLVCLWFFRRIAVKGVMYSTNM